jgi:hypothetical protein
MITFFVSFDAKNLVDGQKLSTRVMKAQIFFKRKNFSFHILMDFYLVLSRGVYPRFSQPKGHGAKHL